MVLMAGEVISEALWSVKKWIGFLTELSVSNYTSDYVAVSGAASPLWLQSETKPHLYGHIPLNQSTLFQN